MNSLHSKTPIPSVTYEEPWLHSDYHCDDVVTVLQFLTLWLLNSDYIGLTGY